MTQQNNNDEYLSMLSIIEEKRRQITMNRNFTGVVASYADIAE